MVYKAYGCVVVDTDTKRIKAVHVPVILDLVQDRVRNRFYSVLLTLLIIVAAAYWALGPALRHSNFALPPASVAKVKIVLPVSYSIGYGNVLSPPLVATVLSSDNSLLSKRSVSIIAVPIELADYYELALLPFQSYLGQAFAQVTDIAGTVQFANITFAGNSQIKYKLYCICENVTSEPILVTVSTNVSVITLVDPPITKLTPAIGKPLGYPLVVQVWDADGLPLANKEVMAAINPFSDINTIFPAYGVLQNFTAISNDYGIADFSALAVVATTQMLFSIQFFSEGISLTPSITDLAIECSSNVFRVDIEQPPPESVVEGEVFNTSTIITVFDSVGNPIAGKIVLAVVTTEANYSAYPKVYTILKTLYNVVSVPTDKDGRAEFSKLKFDSAGYSGRYGITFYCDGVPSEEASIDVYSSVKTLQLLSPPPTVIGFASDSLPILLVVTDSNNSPISDKMVVISGTTALGYLDSSITDDRGRVTFMTNLIPLIEAAMVLNATIANLTLTCDGVAIGLQFAVDYAGAVNPGILLQVVTPPSGIYTISKLGVQPVFKLISPEPVNNITIFTGILSYGSTDTLYELFSRATSDENGIVTFTTFGFSGGMSGAVTVAFAFADDDVSAIYEIVNMVVQVYNPISSVQIQSMSDVNSTISQVSPGVPLNLSITLNLDEYSPEFLESLYPTIVVLTGEHYYYGYDNECGQSALPLFNGTGTTKRPKSDSNIYVSSESDYLYDQCWDLYISPHPCSASSTNIGTCTFGNMTVLGYPGRFTVAVLVAGVISNSLTFEVGNNVQRLDIIPSTDTLNVSLGEPFPITAAVKVLGYQGIPMQGFYVKILPCEGSNITIVNYHTADLAYSISSTPSDENGIAYFYNLQVLSGVSNAYLLCFHLNFAEEVWPTVVYLFNPIYFVDSLNYHLFVEQNSYTTSSFDVYTNNVTFPFSAPIVFTYDGPGDLSISFPTPPICNITPQDTGTTCFVGYSVNSAGGYYTIGVTIAGFHMVFDITMLINTHPVALEIDNSGNTETNSFNSTIFEATTFTVTGKLSNFEFIQVANVTLTLLSEGATIDTSINAPSSSSAIEVSVIFTYGSSGTYELLIASPPLSYILTFYLTNPVEMVLVNVSSDPIKATFNIPTKLRALITAIPQAGSNCSELQGRPVNAILQGYTGVLQYPTTLLDENCTVVFTSITFLVTVPGSYSLQFDIDGVISETIPVDVANPTYPNYEHLNLHHAQQKLVLGVLLMIPLYIGNSVRQPAWQLAISIPALSAIGYIAYSYLATEITSKSSLIDLGYAYYSLDTGLRTILIATFVVFIGVAVRQIYSSLHKKPAAFFDTKLQASRLYIRHVLVSYGLKRFESHEVLKPEVQHPSNLLKRLILKFTPRQSQYDAFFYPQRLLIGCASSIACAFIVACTCIQLTDYLLGKLHQCHAFILDLMNTAQQLQNFAESGGAYFNGNIDGISNFINISPQQLQAILATFYRESTLSLQYGATAEKYITKMSSLLQRTSLVAIVLTGIILILCWLFVFYTYKQRIFLLRKGRLADITLNGSHFSGDKAATYVGLQALHSACSFFILWFTLTSLGIVLQVPQFWRWIWSYFPVLVAFLIGIPFLSKTITKFIISKWIYKNDTILHLRLWLIFDFMWIFVNMLSTMVLSIFRFVASAFINIIYTMRMDYPLLREEYDYHDYGFKAYMGMLLMDHANNNPIFLQFCELLIEGVKKARKIRKKKLLKFAEGKRKSSSYSLINAVVEEPIQFYSPLLDNSTKTRLISKWWLLVTLHNNPSLQALRKHALNPPQL